MITSKEANDILIQLEHDLKKSIEANFKSHTDENDPFPIIRFKDTFYPEKDDREEVIGVKYNEGICIIVQNEDSPEEEVEYNLATTEVFTTSDLVSILEHITISSDLIIVTD